MLLRSGDLIPVKAEAVQIPWTKRKAQVMNFLHRGAVTFETFVYDSNVGDISQLSSYFNPERWTCDDLNNRFGTKPDESTDSNTTRFEMLMPLPTPIGHSESSQSLIELGNNNNKSCSESLLNLSSTSEITDPKTGEKVTSLCPKLIIYPEKYVPPVGESSNKSISIPTIPTPIGPRGLLGNSFFQGSDRPLGSHPIVKSCSNPILTTVTATTTTSTKLYDGLEEKKSRRKLEKLRLNSSSSLFLDSSSVFASNFNSPLFNSTSVWTPTTTTCFGSFQKSPPKDNNKLTPGSALGKSDNLHNMAFTSNSFIDMSSLWDSSKKVDNAWDNNNATHSTSNWSSQVESESLLFKPNNAFLGIDSVLNSSCLSSEFERWSINCEKNDGISEKKDQKFIIDKDKEDLPLFSMTSMILESLSKESKVEANMPLNSTCFDQTMGPVSPPSLEESNIVPFTKLSPSSSDVCSITSN